MMLYMAPSLVDMTRHDRHGLPVEARGREAPLAHRLHRGVVEQRH